LVCGSLGGVGGLCSSRVFPGLGSSRVVDWKCR
jgi:hypothetical protein